LGAFSQETAGLYPQDQVKLPYNFILLAGARYQYIHQFSDAGTSIDGINSCDEVSTTPGLTASAVTPRFGVLWRPESWVSFCGDYTEGFGPNSGLPLFPGLPLPPTSAHEAEAGVKLEFFDGKLRLTADFYDLTKTNIPTADLLHPNFDTLIGTGRSKGPELDIQGEILPGWNVIAAYTNQDVRVTQSNDQTLGERFPFIPRNVVSFWTTYEFQQENLKGWKIGGGVHYQDGSPVFGSGGNFQDFHGGGVLTAPCATLNLMAAYSFKWNGVKLTAQLNVTNLLDATYYTNAAVLTSPPTPPGLLAGYRIYGAPQTFLGSIRAEF
jgi:iron complex outermembrane recepter protein